MLTVSERVAAEPYWFLRMDLGNGIVTPGWSDPAREKLPYFGLPENVAGFRVLDVGCAEGFFSFEAERRGAAEVVSVDFDPECIKRFGICADALGSSIVPQVMSVYDLDPQQLGTFDLVMFFGLLYHLPNPLLGIEKVAAMTRGTLLIQSRTLEIESLADVPLAQFSPDGVMSGPPGHPVRDPTCFWDPNAACMAAMLAHVGLRNIERLDRPPPPLRKPLMSRLHRKDSPPRYASAEIPRRGTGEGSDNAGVWVRTLKGESVGSPKWRTPRPTAVVLAGRPLASGRRHRAGRHGARRVTWGRPSAGSSSSGSRRTDGVAADPEVSVMTPVAVEVSGLTKRFGDVVAVDDLSFAVEPGQVTGFLGPNGAGKTTTLRMILGLVTPSAGSALVNGMAYRDLTDPGRTVGAVLEATGFHPARTARNHLRTIAVVDGIAGARIDEVLNLVGLAQAADRKVGGFSLGMRQRLELARALLGDPPILILDEPANGLDPQGIAWMRGFLRWYASLGRVVLISSHLLAEAAQTVDNVVIVAGGRLAAKGPLSNLLQGSTTTVRVRTPDAGRLVGLLNEAGMAARTEGPDVVVAEGTTAEAVGPVMAENGVVVYEMTSTGESLEQLFFEKTDGDRGRL